PESEKNPPPPGARPPDREAGRARGGDRPTQARVRRLRAPRAGLVLLGSISNALDPRLGFPEAGAGAGSARGRPRRSGKRSKYARVMATLGEVMSRDVITIEPFDTIGHAAEKMGAEGVSAIVVSGGGGLNGIVPERDLTRAFAGRVHSSEARVREWMTADPKVVSESTDPVEAVQIMLDGEFRHLPVVENERAVGIVSIKDLAEWSIRSET